MIKIRYRDPHELSPGLHAAAEHDGRSTTVYLLPGLSAAQRRAALRRLKLSARRGYGPRLPASQLALALLAYRVRTTAGHAGAVFRSHPAGSTVPVMVVSAGAIAFLALSAVSIQVIHPARDTSQPSFSGAAAGLPANARSGPGGPLRSAGGQADRGQAVRAARSPACRDRARGPLAGPRAASPPGTTPARAAAQARAPARTPDPARAPAGPPWIVAPTRRPLRVRRPPAPRRPPRPPPRRRLRRPRPAPRPRRAPPRAGCA